MKTKDVKLNFFKSVGNFFFFSFTKVKSKHVRPLATNNPIDVTGNIPTVGYEGSNPPSGSQQPINKL